jgi:hypothetical protein
MSTPDGYRSTSFAGDAAKGQRRLGLRPLAQVKPRQVRWLLPGLIPLRTITLVAGVGGLGKSTWLAGVAARCSRGDLLDGTPADVVIVTFEDPAAEVLRPRVEAASGDLERVHEVVVEGLDGIDPMRLPRDVGELDRVMGMVDARLLIIDPIVAALDTAVDSYKDQDVRVVLAQLASLAASSDCAVALVGHLNKTPSRDAYIRVANSIAFWNASRSVVLVTEDDGDEPDLRLVAQRKANWARERPVERHRIESIVLPGTVDPDTGEMIETSRMLFVEVADDLAGADVLVDRRSDTGKRETAIKFLKAALDDGGWHDSAGLKRLAAAGGVRERTLQRAANELNVEHEQRGYPASTYWRLPQSRQTYPHSFGATAGAGANPHGSAENDGANPSVAPARQRDKRLARLTRIPVAGDADYPDWIDRKCHEGCITEREWIEQRKLHAFVLRQSA